MKLNVVLKGERIPTPCYHRDGTMSGFVRRQAAGDGVSVDGGEGFLSVAELEDALARIRAARKAAE